MKQLKHILFTLIIALYSCEGRPIEWNMLEKELVVHASIHKNEIGPTKWHSNDTIGLFLFSSESNSYNSILVNNISYNNDNDTPNIFQPSSEIQAIYPQHNNTPVHLIGYFPYNKHLTDFQYPINISDISANIKMPFLYSDNCRNITINNTSASMVFEQQLSKLIIEIENITSDYNITILVTNLPSYATFDLQKGFFNDYDEIDDIKLQNNKSNRTAETLLFPSDIPSNSYIRLCINDTAHYTLKTSDILKTSKLAKGKKYIVKLKLSEDLVSELTSEIIDWKSIYFDELIITETDENTDSDDGSTDEKYFGDGTQNNPYNVFESQLFQGEKDVWTEGYIVGGFKVPNVFGFTTNLNECRSTVIAIADSKHETNIDFIIPVELPIGNIRNNLNLIDNPHLLGKKIIIRGNLERYYQAPGIKHTKEFIIP